MKRTIISISILIILVIQCIFLTACQTGRELKQLQRLHDQYNAKTDESEYTNDDDVLDRGPEKGGVLNLFTTEPDTLNPILTKNAFTADILSFVYEGMTKLDENQKAKAVLADRWSVSDDGLIWEFHIRDGVKWHDGELLTAYDVEFTIQTLLNPGISSVYKPLLLNISTCAAVDSSTIRIALKKPNSFMPEMMDFPIIPKHLFIDMDILSSSGLMKPVGTGPYRFDSHTEGESVVLKLNEDWWNFNENETLKIGSMYLETIQANIFKNAEDMMAAFQSGAADVAAITVNEYHKYKGRTDLNIKKYTSRDFEFISFNLDDPVLSDIYARKAISSAIDREKIINELLPGDAVLAELPVLPSSWIEGYSTSQAPAEEETSGESDETLTTGQNEAVSITEDILIKGGWKKNQQGYYKVIKGVRRYLSTELAVNSNNSIRVRAAQMICEQLEAAGIKVKLVQMGWNELVSNVNAGKHKMAFIGCRVPQIPDVSYLYSNSYLPESLSSKTSANAKNISGYSDPEVDDFITALFTENDMRRRVVVYNELKRKVLDDCPYVGLYFMRDAMVYSKEIKGRMMPDTWNRFNDMTSWYKPVGS